MKFRYFALTAVAAAAVGFVFASSPAQADEHPKTAEVSVDVGGAHAHVQSNGSIGGEVRADKVDLDKVLRDMKAKIKVSKPTSGATG